MTYVSALIVGSGSGLSASLARAFAKAGMSVALAARSTDKLRRIREGDRRESLQLRCREHAQVDKLFADLDAQAGTPDVVIYNASYRTRGPLLELDPVEVERAIEIYGLRRLPGGAGRGQVACCRAGRAPSCSPAPRHP